MFDARASDVVPNYW